MIKRTIHIGSPCKLSLAQQQMTVTKRDAISQQVRTVPIEDMGLLLIEEPQVSITHGLIAKLLEHNVAIISCDARHHPTGMMLNVVGNSTQTETMIAQTECSKPRTKQMWQQVIKAKIANQAMVLETYGVSVSTLLNMAKDVRSGDPDNRESAAAVYYWPRLFEKYPGFQRGRDAGYPNFLLNYGYAILRAVVARAVMGSGLHPSLGIFHRNRYNAYCLADDLMEAYRPTVDLLVAQMVREIDEVPDELTKEMRIKLLSIPTLDVRMNGKKRPLLVAATETTASVARAMLGGEVDLVLPKVIGLA